ncbi:MAG: tRNA uridine-5-carboxymethylaminomethyl(34) synthesis enzyme MnmG, partial [Flavobacteriaceae bacterium]|nr:tRNA uridine-5-carboxymethylaminomethyl(34) synthesis enzyme MnmG [Flavobacteriaceae bacterium]
VKGFEKVKFFRPGYAIEYDYFPPTQLKNTLETKLIRGLFFAGQINGTTGYEEAASQGLMAGINAHLMLNDQAPFVLKRNEAYIGVLIDDLITKGTDEPYRMFTSRAEYRTLLRQDNADLRLTPISFELGLASEDRMKAVELKSTQTKELVSFFKSQSYNVSEVNMLLEKKNSNYVKQPDKLNKIFSRPNITREDMMSIESVSAYVKKNKLNLDIIEQAEIQIKYEGYIKKEIVNAEKLNRLDRIKVPEDFDYNSLGSLSLEAKEKLNMIKPANLSQASRISGINPSDISVLLVKLGR